MKIIDRYVLGTFVRNYLIAFMVLIGMYIALDMVFNFSNLTQNHGAAMSISMGRVIYDIFDFYFYQSFFFFVQLSGMIAVVAAAFTLLRLSRYNEMTALLAAGTPLLRVALSVVVCGVVLNLVLLPIDQEIIIPRMIPKLIRDHSEVHQSTVRTFPVHMMEDEHNALFSVGMYYPPQPGIPAHVDYLDVIDRGPDLMPTAHITARSAVWNAARQQWDLAQGQIVPIEPPDQQTSLPTARPVSVYKSDVTPDSIALNLGKDYVQLLPTTAIDRLLALKRFGIINLLRTKHMRFALPLANVIMLLLAISTVLTREPGTLKTAALRCMGLTGTCMLTIFLSYQLAGSEPSAEWINIWPALLAWMPIFIFGPLAVFMLDRVKT